MKVVSRQQWVGRLMALSRDIGVINKYDEGVLNCAPFSMDDEYFELTGLYAAHLYQPHAYPRQTRKRIRAYATLRKKASRARAHVKAQPVYQRLLKAYASNDQLLIVKCIPTVFGVEEDTSLVDGALLFHGIDFDPSSMSLDDYIDHVLKIQVKGLKPSPFNLVDWMDEDIRPVYCVKDALWTHGLLFFGFESIMNGYKAFCSFHNQDVERMIYAPLVKVPLTLYFKTPSHISSKVRDNAVVFGWGDRLGDSNTTYEELRRLRDQLEARMRERGIPFEFHEADPKE